MLQKLAPCPLLGLSLDVQPAAWCSVASECSSCEHFRAYVDSRLAQKQLLWVCGLCLEQGERPLPYYDSGYCDRCDRLRAVLCPLT